MTTVHTATVSRVELGVSALSLISATYDVISLDGGLVRRRREEVESPYVPGATEVGSVKGAVEGTMVVRVKGTAADNLQSNVDGLLDAFSQSTYTLTVGLDGTQWGWTCRAADYRTDFDVPMRRVHLAKVTLAFPRSPVPYFGPY